jgi:uncharacterized SAM-binding protein YcdF (DUF218 family)
MSAERIGPEDLRLAQVVWDYLRIEDPLQPADGILCLGSSDVEVADWAARYQLEGWAPWILFSGNVGRLTEGLFTASEAEVFAARARAMGVPDSAILLEPRSTNTGENIRFSRAALEERGMIPRKLILVQKPYMGRRALATMSQFWPEPSVQVRSWPVTLEEYLARFEDPSIVVDLMVGDLQRMKVYPPLGYQAPVEIPPEVWEAFESLVDRGYRRQLVA